MWGRELKSTLRFGPSGTHSAGAATFDIEHLDSGRPDVRPTKRGQAAAPRIFVEGGAQRRDGDERLGVGWRVQHPAPQSSATYFLTLRGSRRHLISSCSVSHLSPVFAPRCMRLRKRCSIELVEIGYGIILGAQ